MGAPVQNLPMNADRIEKAERKPSRGFHIPTVVIVQVSWIKENHFGKYVRAAAYISLSVDNCVRQSFVSGHLGFGVAARDGSENTRGYGFSFTHISGLVFSW